MASQFITPQIDFKLGSDAGRTDEFYIDIFLSPSTQVNAFEGSIIFDTLISPKYIDVAHSIARVWPHAPLTILGTKTNQTKYVSFLGMIPHAQPKKGSTPNLLMRVYIPTTDDPAITLTTHGVRIGLQTKPGSVLALKDKTWRLSTTQLHKEITNQKSTIPTQAARIHAPPAQTNHRTFYGIIIYLFFLLIIIWITKHINHLQKKSRAKERP